MRIPVLCWPLGDDAARARVMFVGEGDAEVARSTTASALASLAEELRRGGIPDPVEIEDAVFRR